MPNSATPEQDIHTLYDTGVATSKVVTTVFERVLDSIVHGRLVPGQRISDMRLAEEFGVSRTPVREALQRLREIGVVEASASRFTRVAVISPRQTAEAMVVWRALFEALLVETIPLATATIHEEMARDHADFKDAVSRLHMQDVATSNFYFFSRLVTVSHNEALRRAITSVVHIVQLGSLHLPDYLDFVALTGAQAALLDAVRVRDLRLAQEAMVTVGNIRVPSDEA